jgi:hypothetical protein
MAYNSYRWYSKEHKTTERFGNRTCFRPQVRGWETPTTLGPLERANLNHRRTYFGITTATII